ncbi:MAG: 16S rRNA (cytosine(967)-C(5))-methyltransferase, partial [Defluviitaleaceae bacterium]|nr:16S rRNA (cytosine(967)-C(5))-methyltransferase [Defluviitaleaceae bacterium]
LASAAACLKKGGTLVYCTCTVAREENIGNVRWFLKKFPFESAPIDHGTDGETSFVEESCLQILPDLGGDAFFIARMTKKDE